MTNITNSLFINVLRGTTKGKNKKIKITHPLASSFSLDAWKSDFKSFATDTNEEINIYEAGKWCGKTLRALKDNIHELGIDQYERDTILEAAFTYATNTFAHINYTSTSDINIPSPLKVKRVEGYTVDQVATSMGDVLNRLTREIGKINFKGTVGYISVKELEHLFSFFNIIYIVEYLFSRILWCGWKFKHRPNKVSFYPEASHKLQSHSEAISEEVRSHDMAQFMIFGATLWDQNKLRKMLPWHINLKERCGSRASYAIINAPPKEMPFYLPLIMKDIDSWKENSFQEPNRNLNGLGTSILVAVWQIIYEAFWQVYKHETQNFKKGGTIDFSIQESDLTSLICSLLNVPGDTAKQLLHQFIFSSNQGDGLWSAPLIRLDDGRFLAFYMSLITPNLQRMVDYWITDSKDERLLNMRGNDFEKHARATLKQRESKLANEQLFSACNTEINYKNQNDLIFRINNDVYICECKYKRYPTSPDDLGRYFLEIEKGAGQANTRINDWKTNKPKLANYVSYHMDPSNLNLLPLVVSPYTFGSGITFNKVPCINLDDLAYFFDSDKIHYGATTNKDGSPDGGHILNFKPDKLSLSENFKRYLSCPPTMYLYSRRLNDEFRKVSTDLIPEGVIEWLDSVIDMPTGDDFDDLAINCARDWPQPFNF